MIPARAWVRLVSGRRINLLDPQPWREDDYAAHKRADRLAAASEALHVAGWPRDEIRDTLLIAARWPTIRCRPPRG